MKVDEKKSVSENLKDYVDELDALVSRMKKCNFPFPDIVTTYDDVSQQLHEILNGGKSDEA